MLLMLWYSVSSSNAQYLYYKKHMKNPIKWFMDFSLLLISTFRKKVLQTNRHLIMFYCIVTSDFLTFCNEFSVPN